MLELLKKALNLSYTENGAVTHRTAGSDCLDFFAAVGALRNAEEEDINERFMRAFAESPDCAMKILFFARDIRGGLGERRVFLTILKWLAKNEQEALKKNIGHIAEYGRFDDVLSLFGTPCEKEAMALIKNQLEADIFAMNSGKEVSLLAKWLPSVNASSAETVLAAKKIVKYLAMTDAEYRKLLAKLRAYIKIIENNLREKDYSFDYERQPSKALFKYRKAFLRNDSERYGEFLSKVNRGEAKLNTAALLPYDVIRPCFERRIDSDERAAMNSTWNALPDFTAPENAIAVIDGSGSMYCGAAVKPIVAAISLGIYFAERNRGEFANHFITFSHSPRLVEIKGRDIFEKVRYCASFCEVADTNIQSVFTLILAKAVENSLPQKEIPEKIYIISDMEFNSCAKNAGVSNFEYVKSLYASYGYKLPQIVFWNVNSRNRQQPVTMTEQGVALVSGFSPRIFSLIMSGIASPYSYMVEVINSERYKNISA